MRVPTRSAGTRSGVNWIRRNEPRIDLGERLDGQRLREPRHAFDQQVALRQDRDQHALEEVVLSDDHFLDFIKNALHQRRDVAATVFSVIHTLLARSCD